MIDAIEAERSQLMKVQALLSCTLIAMECEGNDNAPYYPDLLQLAQDMVNRCIVQLDSLRLRPMLEAMDRNEPTEPKEDSAPVESRGENDLRDSANIIYIVSPSEHVSF